ncbi:hypothetical protein PRN20_17865 [Devosia sp. ZB163]|uniref:hypothetical protein n=1 Tax=Devosia sp. ZB163 TaxID=3025938 RepID=UPI002361071F|nr:hypothetical protein [Devosia sp. ZB163]MDC9825604.1 hypothetical protein [Devosia sp. ZB163]
MPRPPIDPPAHATGPVPHLQRPARQTIPHTTHGKVELYLVIAPQLEALADGLMQLNLKTAGLAAEPQVVAQAAGLLRDARRLLRGEPGAHLADLDFTPPMRVQALALGVRQLSHAVAGFRDRYYGYNPLTDGPDWAVADAFGNPDPRWLGRPATVGRTLDELNLMTAEVLRSQLRRLADHQEVTLPPGLRPAEKPEESEAEEGGGDAGDTTPETLPPYPRISRRRTRRYIRANKRRGERKRGEWSPPGRGAPAL